MISKRPSNLLQLNVFIKKERHRKIRRMFIYLFDTIIFTFSTRVTHVGLFRPRITLFNIQGSIK